MSEANQILLLSVNQLDESPCEVERSENVTDGTSGMNGNRKSDNPILPAKRANKAGIPVAESAEERGLPKGNAPCHKTALDTEPDNAGKGDKMLRQDRMETSRPSHLREEPYEVILHVRICAGGGWKQPFLPRSVNCEL